MSIIEVENLSKRYNIGKIDQSSFLKDLNRFLRFKSSRSREAEIENIYWALKNVSFSIKEGQVTGIVGKNGAGKSTLLKILSNIVSPSEGTVKIRGRVSSLLEVGTGFHPELTGRENIFLNGAILGMKRPEIKEKFDAIVDFSGVNGFIDTPVKRYSSGMYVRLAFAVAAFLEPEILILDEVLAVGDSEFQKKCIEKMNHVAKNGQTVLFVSHSIPSIQSLCNQCIYLDKGHVKSIGSTEEVLTQYLSYSTLQSSSRSGNLEASCSTFRILNAENEDSTFFLPNEKIIFKLDYESEVECDEVTVAVGIDTQMDQRVTSFWSEFKGERFQLNKGLNSFEITVPSNKFIPGTYNLVAYLGKGGIVLEEIKNISTITIGIDAKNECVVPAHAHGLFTDDYYSRKTN